MKLRLSILFLVNFLLFTGSYANYLKADSIVCDSGRLTVEIAGIPTFNGAPFHDGDLILVHYNDGVYAASDSFYYSTIATNSVILVDIFPETTDSFHESVNFVFYSGDCMTHLVEFNIAESATNYCYVQVDSLRASSYTISYPSDVICLGTDSIWPITNAPESSIIFNSDSLSCIESNGILNTANCRPGNYTIDLSSNYCLSTNSIDITISEPEPIEFEDTITICQGDPVYQNPVFDHYTFYIPGDTDGIFYNQLTTEGLYVIGSDSLNCVIPDTAYVEIGETPAIDLDMTEECDRVVIRYNNTREVMPQIRWWNGEDDDQIEIYEDTFTGLTVTDEWGCTSYDSFNVVLNPLGIPSIQFEKEDASCWVDGNIDISSAEISNSVGSTRYQLRNTINGRLYNTLENVPEGIYSIEVVDDRNCIATYNEYITIVQRCLEDYPVFTPNGDDIEDSYFIPYEGSVKILDIEGKLIRELNTPDYWDGNDDTGSPMPMGTYVIITDNDRIVNITIVK